ncbi:hypothetical protein [Nevskia sp.]|uniref:GumC family protein n=1 Tax=Nevskia sp. TaxID=1929292 RepID=UPI0025F059E4|nr:hypothetical protein [Nevskia sp.]
MAMRDQLPVIPMSAATPMSGPVVPQQYTHPGMSIAQLIAISKAFWKHSVLIALAVSLLVGVMGVRKPKTYVATATLIIKPEVNDPIAGKEFPLQLLGNYMATQLELISSSVVLQLVVDRLKLQDNEKMAGPKKLPEDVRRAAAEASLQASLGVNQGRYGSQLVYVSYTANSPVEAADTANTIAEIYASRDYERRSPDTDRTIRAFSAQLAELKAKVTKAQAQLMEFQQRTGIISGGKDNADDAALASLQEELIVAQGKRRALEIAAYSAPGATIPGATSELLITLRNQLAEQEAKMAEYRLTDGPKNPRVIELKTQIAVTQREIDKAVRSQSTSANADLTNARQLEAKIRAAIAEQGKRVISQSQLREEGEKYRVELESAQTTYRNAFERFDEITRATNSSYNNIKLVSRATPPTKASSRRTRTTVMMAVVLGMGAGGMLPLMYGLLFRRVRCRDDIERDYGIPVIVEFNAIPA